MCHCSHVDFTLHHVVYYHNTCQNLEDMRGIYKTQTLFKWFLNSLNVIKFLVCHVLSTFFVYNFKAETHDATNRCVTSPRQVAATKRLV